MDRTTTRRYLIVFGGLFLALSLARVWAWVAMPDDNRWTPPALSLSLGEAGERVEVYVRGAPLRRELEAGRVRLDDDRLGPEEVRVRLNHRDRVRLDGVPVLLVETLVAGMALVFLGLGLTGWLPSRGPREGEG
jgi:hypothetical protein